MLGASRGRGASRAGLARPGEIVFAAEFYDYAAKYDAGGWSWSCRPASPRTRARAASSARARGLRARRREGLARVDFFVDGEHVLVNELNTMPGFTPDERLREALAATGIAYPALVERLCRLARERHEQRPGRLH